MILSTEIPARGAKEAEIVARERVRCVARLLVQFGAKFRVSMIGVSAGVDQAMSLVALQSQCDPPEEIKRLE